MFMINWPWSSRTSQMDTLQQENSALRAEVGQLKKELSLLRAERGVSTGTATELAVLSQEAMQLAASTAMQLLSPYSAGGLSDEQLLDILRESLKLCDSICDRSIALQNSTLESTSSDGTQKQTDSSCQCKMLKGISLG